MVPLNFVNAILSESSDKYIILIFFQFKTQILETYFCLYLINAIRKKILIEKIKLCTMIMMYKKKPSSFLINWYESAYNRDHNFYQVVQMNKIILHITIRHRKRFVYKNDWAYIWCFTQFVWFPIIIKYIQIKLEKWHF